ncbi:MAG: Sua5/YciO/YrdC/YwlC family protein, partial [Acidobacteria bacterium]|nr:Sua5/YciO/YrdC/YwlC family protein [Acidobacteriota bacterium]
MAESAVEAATTASIERAGALLVDGGLVAFPTETVYGLGARIDRHDALARIF